MNKQFNELMEPGAEAYDPGAEGGENLLRKVHRRLVGTYRYTVPLGLVLGVVAGAAAYKAVPNKYQSNGVIQVTPTTQRVLYSNELNEEMPMFDAWVDAQVGQIQSPRVLELAMKNKHWVEQGLSLSRNDFFEDLSVSRNSRSLLIHVSYTAESPAVAQAAVQSVIEAYREVHLDQSNRGQVWTVETLQGLLSELDLQERDMRNRIAEIAGPLSPSAMRDLYEAKFTEQVDLEAMITTSKLELAAIRAQTPGGGAGEDAPQPGAESDATGTAGAAADEAAEDGPPVRTAEELATIDDTLAGLIEDRRAQSAILAQVVSDYGDQHREARKIRQALWTLDRRIATRTDELNGLIAKRWAEAGESSLEGISDERTPEETAKMLEARIASLTELRDEVKQQAESLNYDITQIDQIQEEREVLTRRKREAEQRLAALRIERENQGRVSVVNEGELPKEPVNRMKRFQFAGLAGIGGGALPLAAVFLLGTLRGRLDHFADAKATLGQDSFLGILPHLPENLADPQQALVASLSVHEIRSMLHGMDGNDQSQSYMVTSPSAGAGKTTLALALGLSYAGAGSKTLLIDFDTIGAGLSARIRRIVRSRLGKLLVEQGLVDESQLNQALEVAERDQRRLGEVLVEMKYINEGQLSEALNKQANQNVGLREAIASGDIESCVTETGVPNLYTLPVGETSVGDVGTFSPRHIRALLDTAREHYDVVLVDTGPILGSLEAAMLAKEVDATILVMAAGDQERNVNLAVERLNQSKAKLAGLIFNRAKDKDVVRFSSSASRRSRMSGDISGLAQSPNGTAVTDEYGPLARATAAYLPKR